MIEFTLLESIPLFPYTCVCGSQERPIIDTHYELGNPLAPIHVYLCLACLRRAGIVVGWLDGAKADELKQLDRKYATKERELARARAELKEARRELSTAEAELVDLNEARSQLQGRLSQLEDAMRAEAAAALDLVGGGA